MLPSLPCAVVAVRPRQVYFSGVVVPAVSGSVAELSAASSALLSFIKAVEDSITVVLRKCVDTFIAEVREAATQRTLQAQRKMQKQHRQRGPAAHHMYSTDRCPVLT